MGGEVNEVKWSSN